MAANTKTIDIRVALSCPTNLKVKRLRRELGPGACWALICLWVYCAANEPDGVLPGWSDDDLESAADWDGMRGAFAEHAVRIGLLDRLNDSGFKVHDWEENQPWIMRAEDRSIAARKAANMRWACAPHADRNAERELCNAPSPPLPSPPLPTQPNPTGPKDSVAPRKRAAKRPLYRWQDLAAIYPEDKMTPDARAMSWWRRHVEDGDSMLVDEILAGASAWCASRQYQDGFGFGICRFLTENIWRKPPPAEIVRPSKAEDLHETNMRAAAGAIEILRRNRGEIEA